MSMKQLEVTIMGQSYVLGCPEGGEQSLLEAVGNVDREMCAIRDSGKIKARERIAVLAALNLAYALAERPLHASGNGHAVPTPARTEDSSWENGSVDLDALVKRLDQALGADGQLL